MYKKNFMRECDETQNSESQNVPKNSIQKSPRTSTKKPLQNEITKSKPSSSSRDNSQRKSILRESYPWDEPQNVNDDTQSLARSSIRKPLQKDISTSVANNEVSPYTIKMFEKIEQSQMPRHTDMEKANEPDSNETKHTSLKEIQNIESNGGSRDRWNNETEFLVSCLGYAVGLGNVWRFPYLCYKNGGGAFFIPYLMMLFFVGMPLFLLEVSLGQFTSQGIVTCWEFAPLFKGLGYAMCLACIITALYYNIIMTWCLRYFFESFTSPLPWTTCRREFPRSQFCSTFLNKITLEDCNFENDLFPYYNNGTCYTFTTKKIFGIYNATLAKEFDIVEINPAESFFEYEGIQVGLSKGFHDLGTIRWDLVFCLFLAWAAVFGATWKGIKSTGKIVYFTALFPYFVLAIFVLTGISKDGSLEGLQFMFSPNISKLSDSSVWKDAFSQVFFSLSSGYGALITLSSYNNFKGDVVRNTLIITIANSLTSVFAGIAVFSFLGHLAYTLRVSVDNVVKSGVGLTFIAYPHAIGLLPGAAFFSALFFFMLLVLGIDSVFILTETITTAFLDTFPKMRSKLTWVLLIICVIGFSVGLCMCTPGGLYIFILMDDFAGGWNLMLIACLECIAISHIYGVDQFCKDIGVMTNDMVLFCMPWKTYSWYWKANWILITPMCCLIIFVYTIYDMKPPSYGSYIFPSNIVLLGHIITASSAILIIMPMIIGFLRAEGSLKQRYKSLTTPTEKWGPLRFQDYVECL